MAEAKQIPGETVMRTASEVPAENVIGSDGGK